MQASVACARRPGAPIPRRRGRARSRPGCRRCSRTAVLVRTRLADLLEGPRVEEEDPGRSPPTASVAPSRADSQRPRRGRRRSPCMSRTARGAQEVGEQGAAGLGRVVDRHRLTGEQQRAVEVLLDERLGAEPLRDLRRLGVARLAALRERASTPPTAAASSRTATPASNARSRRFVRRARIASRSATARLSQTNARSSSFRSSACSALQSSAAARRAPR